MNNKILNDVLAATLVCGTVITMTSCSDYVEHMNEPFSPTAHAPHRITAEQAKKNALFLAHGDGSGEHNRKSLYMHCNWGWGGFRDGYFLSDVLNAEELPYYDDSGNPVTRSSNFRYKLKTSTICK